MSCASSFTEPLRPVKNRPEITATAKPRATREGIRRERASLWSTTDVNENSGNQFLFTLDRRGDARKRRRLEVREHLERPDVGELHAAIGDDQHALGAQLVACG